MRKNKIIGNKRQKSGVRIDREELTELAELAELTEVD